MEAVRVRTSAMRASWEGCWVEERGWREEQHWERAQRWSVTLERWEMIVDWMLKSKGVADAASDALGSSKGVVVVAGSMSLQPEQ